MANMSYCKFQNTATDFADCTGTIEDMLYGSARSLSSDELRAAKIMMRAALDAVRLLMEAIGKDAEAIDEIEYDDINNALDQAQAAAVENFSEEIEE